MQTLERLGADHLKAVVSSYRDSLRAHQEALNRLNVYPVPDGDTGTNMALTLESVVEALQGTTDMATVCKAISHGSLMGARGNSGVILSQILRGIADGCRSCETAGGPDVAAALHGASEAAYAAVMRPVEGTILTVVRAASAGASAAAGAGKALVDILDAAKDAAAEALASTPDLLPVLKEAGVVDAGGAGLLLLLDSFLHVTAGRDVPAPPETSEVASGPGATVPVDAPPGGAEHTVGDLRYEVMYFLEAPDETIPSFKEVWAGIGDSIVVVGGDGIWNCHIHTDDIGAAVEAALDCGRPKRIRVTDLMEQVEEERWVRDATGETDDEDTSAHPHVPTAVVAIATGAGIRRIFRSLGVQQIVAGGQSMNPSTAQILAAVEAAPGDEVVVLPNNKNIIPVAEQVAGLTPKVVRVVKTTGVAEGFAALLHYDPQCDAEGNAQAMGEAADRVVGGEITRAVRSTNTDPGPVEEGDYLGLASGKIRVVRSVLAEAAAALLDVMVGDDHEMVTIIEGEGASAADTRHITEWLSEHRPDVEAEVHHGGQPLYPYLFSVE
ncbi:MAG: Dihydroxyacetone kinase-like protein, phosphatase domain / Dihydroxyacetone kinase-like protein, kinase domain [uncultured Acidimicrobiales bacterium]|uniref:Dihydroxyacetone kinase-like protein, phosphatase domain / Dihydroxyacetone kinase-like protein, kinase domain n=1 Tax=uncultured Acidimicrobiales bacterium TaxID=310071 RepID=A0A6J4HP85_9ACTN|nr:MAG: Dihydroxyacetone kinase-like protein, phosphatase domain / Dihydroxyacetone kinase-like protein, kinase domain [uncultured Acidimicrobiales bacterium]